VDGARVDLLLSIATVHAKGKEMMENQHTRQYQASVGLIAHVYQARVFVAIVEQVKQQVLNARKIQTAERLIISATE